MLDYQSFLADLKQVRQKKNLSQEQLAIQINLGSDAYRKMENGVSPINLERAYHICEFLEVDFLDLVEGNLDFKTRRECQADIKRLEDGVHELRLERERLWELLNKVVKLLNPEASDELSSLLRKDY